MRIVTDLIKLLRPRPMWIIDIDYNAEYDDNSNKIGGKNMFRVQRWDKDVLFYDTMGDFDTMAEAQEFIKKHKSFPLNADGIN